MVAGAIPVQEGPEFLHDGQGSALEVFQPNGEAAAMRLGVGHHLPREEEFRRSDEAAHLEDCGGPLASYRTPQ